MKAACVVSAAWAAVDEETASLRAIINASADKLAAFAVASGGARKSVEVAAGA